MTQILQHRYCTAPMLGATDRHFRQFVRFLSKKTFVYTELVHYRAITQGHYADYLSPNALTPPVALQLGGCDPQGLAAASTIAAAHGFQEVNINAGCPSPKGQDGNFGLCLMEQAPLLAQCVKASVQASPLPVTIKCRLGSRMDYTWEELLRFIDLNANAGCRCFIVHARRANMQTWDTHKNRCLPPLHYDQVYRLKEIYPELEWVINGDIKNNEEALEHLEHVDGVMLGRSLYHNLYILANVDKLFFNMTTEQPPSRAQFVKQHVIPYVSRELAKGVRLSHMVRHILGLFQNERRANTWRHFLSRHAYKPQAGPEVLLEALKLTELS